MLFDKQGKLLFGLLMTGMISMPIIGAPSESAPATVAAVEPVADSASGLASDEKVSRLLVEGRKAFQDGDMTAAEKSSAMRWLLIRRIRKHKSF